MKPWWNYVFNVSSLIVATIWIGILYLIAFLTGDASEPNSYYFIFGILYVWASWLVYIKDYRVPTRNWQNIIACVVMAASYVAYVLYSKDWNLRAAAFNGILGFTLSYFIIYWQQHRNGVE